MIKLSTRTRYGVRILIQVALENIDGGKLARGRTIAEKQGITEPYLEQIMIPLKRAGIVGTVRGCNGGYELRKSPSEITMLELIELFDGKVELADCLKEGVKCDRGEECPTRDVWIRLARVFREEAATVTLESILEGMRSPSSGEYVI